MVNKSLFALIVSVLCLTAVWQVQPVRAAADNPLDTVAIRVLPNPDHLRPLTWYKANVENQGAPQELLVDGYDAIRDGRSVYVGAANVVNGKLYTNIYIISYTQDAETQTQDIFGQLIKYWKFNFDIMEQYGSGTCIGAQNIVCTQDADCSKTNNKSICDKGHCAQFCQLTSECPSGQYCGSQKSKLIRDIKRISDLQEVVLALNQYQGKNRAYPSLPAGSYMSGRSLSVWSSWNETLGPELGYQLPVDPVNKLGSCPGSYDPVTCWDEANKKFATDFTKPVLPDGSLAYAYSYMPKEGRYFLCGNFETDYRGLPGELMCDQGSGVTQANYPIVTLGSMIQPEGPFGGYFRVDSQLDIDWPKTEIVPLDPAGWSLWAAAGWRWDSGSTGLKLSNTSVANQKKLSATAVKLAAGKGYQFFKIGVRVFDIKGNYGYKEGTIRICQSRDCSDVECGVVDDNCGGTLLCGECMGGKSCVANKCI
ncbi:MAG: hypothetical protein WCO55_06385 [Candidatus Falkowbacteria bacterium]